MKRFILRISWVVLRLAKSSFSMEYIISKRKYLIYRALSVSGGSIGINSSDALYSYGIYCFNNLTIAGTCKVEVTAGEITNGHFDYDYSSPSVSILTANEGSLVMISDEADVITSGRVHNSGGSIGLETKSACVSGVR